MTVHVWNGDFAPSNSQEKVTHHATIFWDKHAPDVLVAHFGAFGKDGVVNGSEAGYRRGCTKANEDHLVAGIVKMATAMGLRMVRGGFNEWSARNRKLRADAQKDLAIREEQQRFLPDDPFTYADWELRRDQEMLDKGAYQPYFITTVQLTKAEAAKLLTLHHGVYNFFDPGMLKFLPEASRVRIGREYSTVIYVDLPKEDTPEMLAHWKQNLRADEATVHQRHPDGRTTYRFWWA